MKMKFIKLISKEDQKSYFEEVTADCNTIQPLGHYSQIYPVSGMIFREFEPGCFFDWHVAPREQYIIYLEGEVEVRASSGEIRVFKPGDILLAADLKGKGHTSKTLTKGKSLVISI